MSSIEKSVLMHVLLDINTEHATFYNSDAFRTRKPQKPLQTYNNITWARKSNYMLV